MLLEQLTIEDNNLFRQRAQGKEKLTEETSLAKKIVQNYKENTLKNIIISKPRDLTHKQRNIKLSVMLKECVAENFASLSTIL